MTLTPAQRAQILRSQVKRIDNNVKFIRSTLRKNQVCPSTPMPEGDNGGNLLSDPVSGSLPKTEPAKSSWHEGRLPAGSWRDPTTVTKVKALRKQGKTYREIAEILECSQGLIRKILTA